MRISKNVITHIPAQPEWHVIEPVYSNQKIIDAHYEPIIAWQIESQEIENDDGTSHIVTTTTPITSWGDINSPSDYGLRQPGGAMFLHGEEFTSHIEIVKEMSDQEERKQQRQHLTNPTTTPSAHGA